MDEKVKNVARKLEKSKLTEKRVIDMGNKDIIQEFDSHVAGSYGRLPISLAKGAEGETVDADGKEYIDFGSGIGVNSLGFCDSEWVEAVTKQVATLQHTSNYYYTGVQADFAAELCAITGYEKVFFGNSGAEANECAMKVARKYSFDKYGKGRGTIITLVNSFHGRTMETLAATGQDVFHNFFFPFPEGFKYVPANDPAALADAIDDTVCAIMIEYIQGEGGVNVLSQEFVDAVFQIAEEKDILVIADEVQSGVGRTGKFLAGEHFGKKADIVSLAKGIAGGLPMGACLMNGKTAGVLTPGTHGSTFGGNPVVCAGGRVVLKRMQEPGFLDDVAEKAAYIREKLEAMPGVVSTSGIGLMIGITLADYPDGTKRDALKLKEQALEKGLLVLTAKEKLRLLPPLALTREEIDKGLDILAGILA